MAKILLMILTFLILTFIVVVMYCALIIAGRSDEHGNNSHEGDDNMVRNKQICPRCKTGKYTYELDPKSEACPYIGCWRRNKCSFYKPFEKQSNDKSKTNIYKTHIIKDKILCICGFVISSIECMISKAR